VVGRVGRGLRPPPLSLGGNMEGQYGAGKGDSYRPVDQKKWDENWDKIFGKGKIKKLKPTSKKKPKKKKS